MISEVRGSLSTMDLNQQFPSVALVLRFRRTVPVVVQTIFDLYFKPKIPLIKLCHDGEASVTELPYPSSR